MLANAVWRAFLQNLSNYESSFLTSTFFKKKKSNICILKTNEMKNKEIMQNDKIISFN